MKYESEPATVASVEKDVAPAFEPYTARVEVNNLVMRMQPSPTGKQCPDLVKPGLYTIVDEKNGYGLTEGHKANRDGWINLKYAKRVE